MTEERGALIEAMARALLSSATIAGKWERLSEIALEIYRIDADVALTAISNAGYAVVPVEPTRQMIAKAWDEISKEKRLLGIAKLGPGPAAREVYRAMLSASPITVKGSDE